MLQIMERPLVSNKTAFQPRAITATVQRRPSSSKSLKIRSRPSSAGSNRSNAPTCGYGPSSLNSSNRRQKDFEI